MTDEDVRTKLAHFQGKLERAIAFRAQAQEQAREAEMGVQQLHGACAVLRELLAPPAQPTAGNGLDETTKAFLAAQAAAPE
jgi:hypothetical protein